MTTAEKFNTEFHAGNVKSAMKEADAKSRDLWYVPYNQLRVVEGFNVRVKDADYKEHIAYLANSMVENGYYPDKPMAGYVVNEGGEEFIVVTDGHCRYEAVGAAIERGAPIERVPVVVKAGSTSMADLTVALVTSNSGRPLTPYEIGLVCKRLVDFGWDNADIAKKLSFTKTYVDQLLALMAAPKKVQDAVKAGTVAAGTALDLVKKHGEKAAEVIEKAAKDLAPGKKVTKKHVTKDDPKKMVQKRFKEMHKSLLWVLEDAAYSKLHKDTRELVEAAMEDLTREEL